MAEPTIFPAGATANAPVSDLALIADVVDVLSWVKLRFGGVNVRGHRSCSSLCRCEPCVNAMKADRALDRLARLVGM